MQVRASVEESLLISKWPFKSRWQENVDAKHVSLVICLLLGSYLKTKQKKKKQPEQSLMYFQQLGSVFKLAI